MMQPESIHWPAEAIWQAVAPLLPDFTVEITTALRSDSRTVASG